MNRIVFSAGRKYARTFLLKVILTPIALMGWSCAPDELAAQFAQIQVTPLPSAGQTLLTEPDGIDYGDVALFGEGRAVFHIDNPSGTILEINSLTFSNESGGEYRAQLLIDSVPVELPAKILAQKEASLEVYFIPEADGMDAAALLGIATNTGRTRDGVVDIQLKGKGVFIGKPNLTVTYNGRTYDPQTDCVMDGDVCTLPILEMGNVPLGETSTSTVMLRNIPAPGECLLRPLESGEVDCKPVCAVTFNPNADGDNIGIGFIPSDTGFSLVGGASFPFRILPANSNCADGVDFVRGELRMQMNFAASDSPAAAASTLVIETNDPDAAIIKVPVSAASREAPTAVAKLRLCDGDTLPPNCSLPENLRPLGRAFFDGTDSFDTVGGGGLSTYQWSVVERPPGAPTEFDAYFPNGQNTPYFDMYLPVAGIYTVRLMVTNIEGVSSGISETSDWEIDVIPASRFHLQLVWNDPVNDFDLHLVHAPNQSQDRVYHGEYSCYWNNCKPSCVTDSNCVATPPIWFDTDAALEGGNPRQDIDDASGLGPENINIDDPKPGRYRIYVHYYAVGQSTANLNETAATIRVYADGVLRSEFQRFLNPNDLWAVAEIRWGETDVEVVAAEADGPNVIGSVVEMSSVPFPGSGGFEFSPSPF